MTETLRYGGNAFPVSTIDGYTEYGMTLRDWFAGQIAAGMVAYSGLYGANNGPADIAERSYQIADAMLSARAIGDRP